MISLVPGEGTSYCLEQGSDLKEKRDRGIYCNFVRVFFFFWNDEISSVLQVSLSGTRVQRPVSLFVFFLT